MAMQQDLQFRLRSYKDLPHLSAKQIRGGRDGWSLGQGGFGLADTDWRLIRKHVDGRIDVYPLPGYLLVVAQQIAGDITAETEADRSEPGPAVAVTTEAAD